ncbi:MAG: C1 family peptidase [Phenylobacterium sp.]|uniref:C1 family peptidase n=1 Tax=Phenylobacterium sp. TaxID=1871053 RepID=UPI00273741CA|nr:C1 family peptidase [Phenylobacterium sp.]MDP3172953.1 C1 family peptidase [Phenylobacterium sp.]
MIVDVDLRPQFQGVRHQGQRSACLAFATTAAHERHIAAPELLCVEYLFYHSVQRTPGADPGAGASMLAMGDALRDDGQPVEAVWPYLAAQPAPGAWTVPTFKNPVLKATADMSSRDFDAIVATLDSDRPVVLGLVITASFLRCTPSGRLPPLNPDPARSGHAVLAVGHGRDPSGDQHILIRNSWGALGAPAGTPGCRVLMLPGNSATPRS